MMAWHWGSTVLSCLQAGLYLYLAIPRISCRVFFFYSLASEAKVIFLVPRFPSSRILKLKFVASEPEFAISRVTGVRTLAKQQTGKSHRNRFQHSP